MREPGPGQPPPPAERNGFVGKVVMAALLTSDDDGGETAAVSPSSLQTRTDQLPKGGGESTTKRWTDGGPRVRDGNASEHGTPARLFFVAWMLGWGNGAAPSGMQRNATATQVCGRRTWDGFCGEAR